MKPFVFQTAEELQISRTHFITVRDYFRTLIDSLNNDLASGVTGDWAEYQKKALDRVRITEAETSDIIHLIDYDLERRTKEPRTWA